MKAIRVLTAWNLVQVGLAFYFNTDQIIRYLIPSVAITLAVRGGRLTSEIFWPERTGKRSAYTFIGVLASMLALYIPYQWGDAWQTRAWITAFIIAFGHLFLTIVPPLPPSPQSPLKNFESSWFMIGIFGFLVTEGAIPVIHTVADSAQQEKTGHGIGLMIHLFMTLALLQLQLMLLEKKAAECTPIK